MSKLTRKILNWITIFHNFCSLQVKHEDEIQFNFGQNERFSKPKTDRNSLQNGTLGVRWFKARRDESKILPTKKLGIECHFIVALLMIFCTKLYVIGIKCVMYLDFLIQSYYKSISHAVSGQHFYISERTWNMYAAKGWKNDTDNYKIIKKIKTVFITIWHWITWIELMT